jgi:hypothetical protein
LLINNLKFVAKIRPLLSLKQYPEVFLKMLSNMNVGDDGNGEILTKIEDQEHLELTGTHMMMINNAVPASTEFTAPP